MTPDQKKEREELIEALKEFDVSKEVEKFPNFGVSATIEEIHELWTYSKSYADHYEEIQALKSGEWVLMPIESTEEMADAAAIRPDANVKSDTNLIFYGGILKAMVAARPNVKENDDE